MKTLISILCTLSFCVISLLNAQNYVNFQGIVYADNSFQPARNAFILVNTRIVDASGKILYAQVDTTGTDDLGLVNIALGRSQENFVNVDWSNPNLKIEATGFIGNKVINLGLERINTVPTSFYAQRAGRLDNFEIIHDTTSNQLIAYSKPSNLSARFEYGRTNLLFPWKEPKGLANANFFTSTTRNTFFGAPKNGVYPQNFGRITVFNSNGAMDAYNADDKLYYRLGFHPGGMGSFNLYNTNTNQIAVTSAVTTAGAPTFNLYGPNGQFNAFLSNSPGNANRGYMGIVNENGAVGAGFIYRDNGVAELFAPVKPFRMDHPTQPGKEIWYACVEGPEAAAYARGTAKLQHGQVYVEFPEHFQLTINAGTMTVVLTPLSADSKGLAVVQKGEKGFSVKELHGAKGSYEFDWEVKAVRKGFENFRVIRDASETPLPVMKKFEN